MDTALDIKKVGDSGQITVGRRFAGQHFAEEVQEDGVIILRPVEVLPKGHWLVRDADEIREALEWAKTHKPRATDVGALVKQVNTLRAKKAKSGR